MNSRTDQNLDIEHLRTWIGREDRAGETVSAELVRRFRATLDLPGPHAEGSEAPHLIHLCIAPLAVPPAELGADGHPRLGGFLPPVPLSRRMWAGGSFALEAPLRVGEYAERRSVIEDVTLKQGRSGPLCFVTVRHEIRVEGEVRLTETQDIVYRGQESARGSPDAAAPAPGGEHRRIVEITPTLLFRYSALTFNGHRIHYDRRYAMDVESYPGLVVHGPMQATLLFHQAARLWGAAPKRFRFRSALPLFDDSDLVLHARTEGEGMALWTSRPAGPVSMSAVAEWD